MGVAVRGGGCIVPARCISANAFKRLTLCAPCPSMHTVPHHTPPCSMSSEMEEQISHLRAQLLRMEQEKELMRIEKEKAQKQVCVGWMGGWDKEEGAEARRGLYVMFNTGEHEVACRDAGGMDDLPVWRNESI